MYEFDVGIFGGGQLARMLVLSAHRMGVKAISFVSSANEPSAQVGPFEVGDIKSESSVSRFMHRCRVVTFESEFVNAEQVAKFSPQTTVLPQPSLMMGLRDRSLQKSLLDDHRVPTASWSAVSGLSDVMRALLENPNGVVLKKRLFGYDGYGTLKLNTEDDIEKWAPNIQSDIADPGFIVEVKLKFKRELALSLVRNPQGKAVALPWVETYQRDSRCLWVKGPLKETAGMKKLKNTLLRFISKIDYIGLITFEVFDCGKEYLVNEIAPRVHNSGHYSLDALVIDQFEYHLRAILSMSLPKADARAPGFAMFNLLGRESSKGNLDCNERLHWYGKQEERPGRKMGHINTTDKSAESALRKAKAAAKAMGFA